MIRLSLLKQHKKKGNTWVAIIVVQHEICIDMLDTFRHNILLYIIEQQGLRNLNTVSTNKEGLQYDESSSTVLSCANHQNSCFAKQVLIPLIVVNSPLILLVWIATISQMKKPSDLYLFLRSQGISAM